MASEALLSVATQAASGGLNVGTLLMFVGGAILLAFFSSIGIIARMRERRLEERRAARNLPPDL